MIVDFIVAVLVVLVSIVVVFSRAEECYFCGDRDVMERSKFSTRGLCGKCVKNGRNLP